MSVDNYDDLEDETSESDISHINSFVANFVSEFAVKHAMFSRRVSMDRFYLFTDYTVLEGLMNDKFSVIDAFREEAKQRQLPLTLSMGFSYGDGNHDEIGKVALLNLNLAEVRGGRPSGCQGKRRNKKSSLFWWWVCCLNQAYTDPYARYDDSYFRLRFGVWIKFL